jgi:uncharacterized protein (DUF2384 family)
MLSAFLDHVMDRRRGLISPRRVSAALHVSLAEVARLANVHRNTLTQKPDSPVVQERLGEVARIITAAAELLGGDARRAVIWFRHQPLSAFEGRTAAELTAEGHGGAVLTHLDMLRDGIYA